MDSQISASEDRISEERAAHAASSHLLHRDTLADVDQASLLLDEPVVSADDVCWHASELASSWDLVVPQHARKVLKQFLEDLTDRLGHILKQAQSRVSGTAASVEFELLKSSRMFDDVLASRKADLRGFADLPHVASQGRGPVPRIVSLAEDYLSLAQGIWSNESLRLFVQEAQQRRAFRMDEIQMLPQALRFAHLEFIVDRSEEIFGAGPSAGNPSNLVASAIYSLVRVDQFEWPPLLEALIPFEAILQQDPDGIYAAMDFETRQRYRKQVADLARHADFDEIKTASAAIDLARKAQTAGNADPRLERRLCHVGYYLLAEGAPALHRRIGYHAPLSARLRALLFRFNEDIYLIGIILLTLGLIVPIITPLVPHHNFLLVMMTLLLALLPVSQGAVDLVNAMVSSAIKPEALPKMDYSKGVPSDVMSLVVIPTLLLREKQVEELFEDLEARYLSNEDRNIHFALLTDLPDAKVQPPPDEGDALVRMAMRLTDDLNVKYASGRGGSFLLLHRHRVFNARQGVWMGWERKRGKLLDLNKLLLHHYDSFPIKAGPIQVLEGVRYVITLDSDTALPYGAARRMIGTISHTLNRAIIHPALNIVTVGYGILQPRVGVSVASASRSRLAAIYSGETGFDIYTRAVSDVYQDLFGEGIFTGKGIYEVNILHRVLERRFPRNSLLSHDLIEGAYVRAGLVTDVEVVDDYPSQYHAHTRRKHRWIRGDWQILRWLFSPVPDESGRLVRNPISLVSQWKIFDNLRRSLVEPVTFLVLVFGWFFLPGGAIYWTPIAIGLLVLPALVKFVIDAAKSVARLDSPAMSTALGVLFGAVAVAFLHLTFLAHQMMLSIDAIVRSLNRSLFSGRDLLEWETAAQAEQTGKRTSIDIYLQVSPLLAVALAGMLAHKEIRALIAAGPVLFLWLVAPLVAVWLNSPPNTDEGVVSDVDRSFLEQQALRIWRFYADFGGEENHWLIPDHVEEKQFTPVGLLTPTNIGMLLNARQAACVHGFITTPEFAESAAGSLRSLDRMRKHRGHIFNWYDLCSLEPIQPVEVSTVDSGNLAASLYTLRAGALDLSKQPILSLACFETLNRILPGGEESVNSRLSLRENVDRLFRSPLRAVATSPGTSHEKWVGEEGDRRRVALVSLIEDYLPWLLPKFGPLSVLYEDASCPSPDDAEDVICVMIHAVARVSSDSHLFSLAGDMRLRLEKALKNVIKLKDDLMTISGLAGRLVQAMDFGFLFNEPRQLLSNGYDADSDHMHKPCFDLLATEARTAAFIAVAKGEIPQRSWFRLDRSHTLVKGRAVLLSWTATMFEHLMPTLWMRSYPDTLLKNSLDSVIQVQIDHVHRMPWGISESGYATTDENGRYLYQAWGIPTIALKYKAEDGPVISPYSTFLALPLLRKQSLANLRRMEAMGWSGEYGFYEAADYIKRESSDRKPVLVKSWMAHHQGMSLLAITNVLHQNIFQKWFHDNPQVRAAEQLLHERPLTREMISAIEKRR